MVAANRLTYIDWARGIAVLLMIEAHTTDAWTRAADKTSVAYSLAVLLGGFAAPLFLWLAGVGVALGAARIIDRKGDRRQAVEAMCRRGLEIWCLVVATLLSGLFAWYAFKMVWWSYSFNDVSQANDATPLWIPELAMAIGVSVLFIAFAENLIRVLRGGPVAEDQTAATEQHIE